MLNVPQFNTRLLQGFSAEERSVIIKAAASRRFVADRVIAHQGDRADCLFLLTRGHARHFFITENGRKLVLRWLSSGDIVGAVTFLHEPEPYHVSTEVLGGSQLLMWNRPTLERLCNQYPKLVQNAMSVALDYLDWYLTAHIALACETARQRCAQVLLHVAKTMGRKVRRGVEIKITNEELANTAAISRFETSRLMTEWERSGVLVKARGKITLRSQELR